MKNQSKGDIVIYQTKDGLTKIDVRFEDETVWLTQQQMAELYQSSRTNIVEHIQHMKKENCRKSQPVGNSDRFDWKVQGKSVEKFLSTTST